MGIYERKSREREAKHPRETPSENATSHGGVLGQTRSEKPVIAPGRQEHLPPDLLAEGKAFASAHSPGYKQRDYYDAHRMLMAAALAARAKGDASRSYYLGAVASGHRILARAMQDCEKKSPCQKF